MGNALKCGCCKDTCRTRTKRKTEAGSAMLSIFPETDWAAARAARVSAKTFQPRATADMRVGDKLTLKARLQGNTTAVVYWATGVEDARTKFAVKIENVQIENSPLMNEVRMLHKIGNAHVVKMSHLLLFQQPSTGQMYRLAAMPLFEMDLFTYIEKHGALLNKLELAHAIMSQVSAGLAALHLKDILHGDIKTENVLLKNARAQTPFVCLSDLGSAHDLKAPESFVQRGHTTAFAAPEIVCGARNLIGKKADIFSMGCLLTDLLTAMPLFDPSATPAAHLAHVQRLNLHHTFPATVRATRTLFDRDGYVRGWLPAAIRLQKPWYEYGQWKRQLRPILPFIRRCCHPTPRQRPAIKDITLFTMALMTGDLDEEEESPPPTVIHKRRHKQYSIPSKMKFSG